MFDNCFNLAMDRRRSTPLHGITTGRDAKGRLDGTLSLDLEVMRMHLLMIGCEGVFTLYAPEGVLLPAVEA